jgi:hypothetical protein
MDEMATRVAEQFGGRAALRVAAAGVGGKMCLHAVPSVASEVATLLADAGWEVRPLCPGPPTHVFSLQEGLE